MDIELSIALKKTNVCIVSVDFIIHSNASRKIYVLSVFRLGISLSNVGIGMESCVGIVREVMLEWGLMGLVFR